jgi:hypothetical protein
MFPLYSGVTLYLGNRLRRLGDFLGTLFLKRCLRNFSIHDNITLHFESLSTIVISDLAMSFENHLLDLPMKISQLSTQVLRIDYSTPTAIRVSLNGVHVHTGVLNILDRTDDEDDEDHTSFTTASSASPLSVGNSKDYFSLARSHDENENQDANENENQDANENEYFIPGAYPVDGIPCKMGNIPSFAGFEHLENWIDSIFKGIIVECSDTSVDIDTELGFSPKSKTHTMNLTTGRIFCSQWRKLAISDIILSICPPVENIIIPMLTMELDTKRNATVDGKDLKCIEVHLCGDSFFVLSLFFQIFAENQRVICKRNFVPGSPPAEKEISRMIAESLSENLKDFLFADESSRSRSTVKKQENVVNKITVKNTDIIVDFHRGSDMFKCRLEENKLTVRARNCYMNGDFQNSKFQMMIQSVHTTVGYVDDKICIIATLVDPYWDLLISIPEVNVRTSQKIIEGFMVMFQFNVLWNEYDLLYNESEAIKFRNVTIEEIRGNFEYHSSPIDFKKALHGHWKQMIRLIPPCDIKITFPQMTLRYHRGWEELFSAYLQEMTDTQKVRVAKKVLVGVAKRYGGLVHGGLVRGSRSDPSMLGFAELPRKPPFSF